MSSAHAAAAELCPRGLKRDRFVGDDLHGLVSAGSPTATAGPPGFMGCQAVDRHGVAFTSGTGWFGPRAVCLGGLVSLATAGCRSSAL